MINQLTIPETQNAKHETRNTEHGTQNTEHGTRDTEHYLHPSIMMLQILHICHASDMLILRIFKEAQYLRDWCIRMP